MRYIVRKEGPSWTVRGEYGHHYAARLGITAIGIEREAEYLPLIQYRLNRAAEYTRQADLDLGGIA